jgi:hypothetical protein
MIIVVRAKRDTMLAKRGMWVPKKWKQCKPVSTWTEARIYSSLAGVFNALCGFITRRSVQRAVWFQFNCAEKSVD